jgi:hypothetical protein
MLNFGETESDAAMRQTHPWVMNTVSRQQPMAQRQVVQPEIKYAERPQRHITEIRVYFDDLTYESFVPKKWPCFFVNNIWTIIFETVTSRL